MGGTRTYPLYRDMRRLLHVMSSLYLVLVAVAVLLLWDWRGGFTAQSAVGCYIALFALWGLGLCITLYWYGVSPAKVSEQADNASGGSEFEAEAPGIGIPFVNVAGARARPIGALFPLLFMAALPVLPGLVAFAAILSFAARATNSNTDDAASRGPLKVLLVPYAVLLVASIAVGVFVGGEWQQFVAMWVGISAMGGLLLVLLTLADQTRRLRGAQSRSSSLQTEVGFPVFWRMHTWRVKMNVLLYLCLVPFGMGLVGANGLLLMLWAT